MAPRSKWHDLGIRAASAAVLAPLGLVCLWFGGTAWSALLLLAMLGLAVEWAWLCRAAAARPPGVLVPAVVLLAGVLAASGLAGAALVALGAGLPLTAWRGGLPLASGIAYVGLGAVALLWLRAGTGPVGRGNVLFLMLLVWASDIGAYAAGRLLGGPKLAPSLSPGKTWSGAAGGLLAAMLAGEGVAFWLAPGPPGHAALLAALLGIVAQAGDLLESGIKRRFGVKDSSRLIPGHGGLLDRLDGLLAAAPVAACLAIWISQGKLLWL